jgi:hypothetical protein
MTTETADRRTTRSTFLRRVAVTLGAAIGIAALPAVAHATLNCCKAQAGQCQPPNPTECGDHQLYYCSCPGDDDYCYCEDDCQPMDCPQCRNGPC